MTGMELDYLHACFILPVIRVSAQPLAAVGIKVEEVILIKVKSDRAAFLQVRFRPGDDYLKFLE